MSASTSNTYDFQLSNADLILEAFDRVEMRPPAITGAHMISARRSLQLELQRWSNFVPLLWAVDLISIPLIQGVTTYALPANTVSLLDVYVRVFSLSGVYNITPSFSTVNGQTSVTVGIANHGLTPGEYISVETPVAVGGLVIQGYYPVITVPNTNTFTISASVAATSTVTGGGVVPLYTTTGGSNNVQVTLTNHGLSVGSIFAANVNTLVGGISLFGAYAVTSLIDPNNFLINIVEWALSNATAYENGGLAQVQYQTAGQSYTDRILTPLGRTDYAQIPDKTVQGVPTSYWQDRLISPNVTFWQVPDDNGPYQINAYRMRRLQDASPIMGQVPDVPYRFIDALCGQLALRLAMKYAKDMIPVLQTDADRSWREAEIEDRERADIYITPNFDCYTRD